MCSLPLQGIADVLAYRFGDEATAPLLAAAKPPATFAFRVAVLKVALLRPELWPKAALAEVTDAPVAQRRVLDFLFS